MKKETHSLYEARVAIIKALAHTSRLFIIEELQKQDRNVGELVEMIGADFSTVSKHLTILKNAGLVTDERKGTTINYHLKTPCILNFIGCVEDVLEMNANDQLNVLSCRKK
jgi:ArsR family transcriptional regulator, arsenate/arsenite/antimonite-responsive transcriptional repressor